MTTTMTDANHAISCRRCGEWFWLTTTLPTGATCPICDGKLVTRGTVRRDGTAVHDETRLACNALCQTAGGMNCDCQCGGRNHGVERTVTVTVTVTDGRVKLSLDHPERLAHLADRRLPDIELAERMAADLWDRAYNLFPEAQKRYCAGAWLPRHQYDQVGLRADLLNEIRHARTLRTPAGRIRALNRVADTLNNLPS